MIKIPKGTKDVLPDESAKWHFVEDNIRKIAKKYALNEVRTPIFEHTELFLRGVGDTTDIVNKEMYTFLDKAERSITLKPEGTACVARSFIENGLDATATMPAKMYYVTPVFRYENPQNGRLREHHQFGVEVYGSYSAYTDAEVINVAKDMLATMGVTNVNLYINSIGCPMCRQEYHKALLEYLRSKESCLCNQCKERMVKNPLRVLDCKEEGCKEIAKNAPKVLDYLCDDCNKHFDELKHNLDVLGISFEVDPTIVRGLDYYTGTVFEFVAKDFGLTVCGGGRYNNLITELGGKEVPAVGFGMGIERLLQVCDSALLNAQKPNVPVVYFAPMDGARDKCVELTAMLRNNDLPADTDHIGRSFKSQMKYAGKVGVRFVAVIGESELNGGYVSLKDMTTSETKEIKYDTLVEYLKENI